MKVLNVFYDLQDDGYRYNQGDTYPRKGYTPSEVRIAELASDKNKLGMVLIEVEKPKEETKPKKTKKSTKE